MLRALTASFLLLLALVAKTDDSALRKMVDALYGRWDRASQALDSKTIQAMIHPEFVNVDLEGVHTNRLGFSSMLNALKGSVRVLKCKTKVENYSQSKTEIVAYVRTRLEILIKQGPRWESATLNSYQCQTLKKTARGWLFIMSQDLPN